MNKFTRTIANEIASITFNELLDDLLYSNDGDYNLNQTGEDHLQNFEEDLIGKGFKVTESRLKLIVDCFDKKLNKLYSNIMKYYEH